jgi:DNA mismatch repair protein MutS2
MNQRTLDILEYPRVREEIAGFCMSAEGKTAFLQNNPLTDDAEIALLKEYGACWTDYKLRELSPALTGWPPVAAFLPRFRVEGMSLTLDELHALGLFCESVRKLRTWSEQRVKEENHKALSPSGTILLDRLLAIPDLGEEETEIFRVVDRATGEIRDLPEIRAIRQEIRRIRQDIERLIGSYLSDEGLKTGLQAKLPTIKDGRQVIAVKAASRNRVRGIVHEVSQSGQTVYIEPEDVVSRNNDLVAEENHLAREIARILRAVTDKLCPSYDKFADALTNMLFFDGIAAASSWGRAHSCSYAAKTPTDSQEESAILLKQARHPLLRRAAVPIDLILTPGGRQLIITGPNTGGKTVSLKTVALLALMNQSGWPIPAAPGSSLPVFDFIGCDIGDEQSLDQSLSTFSGHMKNISEILASASEKSLILLDELGSGTDPQEGSAIAMAVLDALMEKNPLVLVTTHHGVLKNYGYTHETCLNASVEFDHDTLSPTYRIVMGIPGESHALEVAAKNGLDQAIVDRARSYLDEERADVSALIQGLTSKHEALDSLEQKKKLEERTILEKRRKVDLKELQLRQKEIELREQGFKKLTNLLEEGRKELENLVRKVREGELTREKTLEVKAWMSTLDEQIAGEYKNIQDERKKLFENKASFEERVDTSSGDSLSGDRATPDKQRNIAAGRRKKEKIVPLVPGMDVKFGENMQRGVLIREDKKGKWLVSVGLMKMTVNQESIFPVEHAGTAASKPNIVFSADMGDRATPAFELRLLGMRADEAEKALERQFDLAIMKGLREFSIIHGKGQGILQQLVHDFLSAHADQCDFVFARPENGGSGKTIVTVK